MEIVLQTKCLQNSAEKQQASIEVAYNRILLFVSGEFNDQTWN